MVTLKNIIFIVILNIILFLYSNYFLNYGLMGTKFYTAFNNVNILIIANCITQSVLLNRIKKLAFCGNSDINQQILLVVLPLLEECIFRHILPRHLEFLFESEIVYIITSILFGMIHVFNYLNFNSKEFKIIVFFQVIFTMILGYNIISTTSFSFGIFLHYYYNFVSLQIFYVIRTFFGKEQDIVIPPKSIWLLKNTTDDSNYKSNNNFFLTHKYICVNEKIYNMHQEMTIAMNAYYNNKIKPIKIA